MFFNMLRNEAQRQERVEEVSSVLRKLLEYMTYIRHETEYMEQSEELFSGTRVTGGLFVDAHTSTPRRDGPIGVYGFGDEVPSPLQGD